MRSRRCCDRPERLQERLEGEGELIARQGTWLDSIRSAQTLLV
jgi:hypothetical protein